MHFRFLLGPAGSGKTARCLDEIRETLRREPEGPPLLLLAPKQSTYQLERQLLEASDLAGWTRLQILSFERLARWILETSQPVELLDETGRVMVLRALLRREAGALRSFRSSARLTGFAQELGTALRELQRHHAGPSRLASLAAELGDQAPLAGKLADLGHLQRAYQDWLKAQALRDADALPDLAADALQDEAYPFQVGGLWLDGFAELTPQEVALLAAVARRARSATLAFCCPPDFRDDLPWLSTWSLVSQTVRRVHTQLTSLPGVEWSLETLPRDASRGRFAGQPALAHLEQAWTDPAPASGAAAATASTALRLVACDDFEQEAEVAAREIWRHVRAGGRFREVAVTLRSLELGYTTLERVFLRYEIPYFLDRREPLAHHPLAELTRSAVRLAAFQWPNEDWFGALKTGLAGATARFADALENEALAHGWDGAVWSRAEHETPAGLTLPGEVLRGVVAPFATLVKTLGATPHARSLVAAIRDLWATLEVDATLRRWAETPVHPDLPVVGADVAQALHQTAREQIDACLRSLELGFGETPMPVRDWLPILDAGLAAVTAGVIPPSQDQVMIGAVDRSRQPDLQLALVLGLNEGRFPAPSPDPGLLTEHDRRRLEAAGLSLGVDRRRRIGHERYYAYIAFTRARRRLVLGWSQRNAEGQPLNVSPFVRAVRALFPELAVENGAEERVSPALPLEALSNRVEHANELVPWLLARREHTPLDGLAGDAGRRAWLRECRQHESVTHLSPALAAALLGPEPTVSLSGLEDFAACPFRHFARHTLRGRERLRHEVDPRETGSLAHALLARFHQSVHAEGRRWRDLTPDEARRLFDQVAARTMGSYRLGLFHSTPEARWQATGLLAVLRDFVGRAVGWMATYGFDPTLVEVAFGGASDWPAWRVELGDGHALRVLGKIDRVDTRRGEDGALEFLVLDYKLTLPRVDDTLIAAGVDLQLATYLLALEELRPWTEAARPAGMFYVGLRARPSSAKSRAEWSDADERPKAPAAHRGRFVEAIAPQLVPVTGGATSGQFALRYNQNGSLRKGGDGRAPEVFRDLLETARARIHDLGHELISGTVGVLPLRLGKYTACADCELQALCRFDAWTQPFRRLN